jgi:hypothetical protein
MPVMQGAIQPPHPPFLLSKGLRETTLRNEEGTFRMKIDHGKGA